MILLDTIGVYGPVILFCMNLYFLWKQPRFLWIYVSFVFLNDLLNRFMKLAIQEPRPKPVYPPHSTFVDQKNMSLMNGFDKFLLDYSYTGEQQYGMPSGHSQGVFFSTVFLWLVNHSVWLLIVEGFICIITVHQRWKYRKHSMEQLITGAILGILFAYGVVFSISPMLK